MEKRFNLTVQEVLDKQFNVDFKGYSSVEVDEFLDLVIADYQEYDEMISTLGDKLQEYEKQINTLKAKIIELEGKQDLGGGCFSNCRQQCGYSKTSDSLGKRSV